MNAPKILPATEARNQFDDLLDRVGDDRQTTILTRGDRESVILLCASDYESLLETVHLLKSPANANRLHDATAQLDSGRGIEQTLLQCD